MAFKNLQDGKLVLIGHQFLEGHVVFNIKMEYYICKARLVVGGHKIMVSATFMCASLVSRETIRIPLMIPTHYDLEVKSYDILNAFVQASNTEKV